MRHAEIALDVFLGGTAFLLANKHHLPAAHGRETANHRLVVLEAPVAVQLLEILAGKGNVIQRVGALGMPGDLDDLIRRQLGIDFGAERVSLFDQAFDLGGSVNLDFKGIALQLLDILLELDYRLFKIVIEHDQSWMWTTVPSLTRE